MGDTSWSTRLTLLEKIKNRHDDDAWEEFVSYYQKYVGIILNHMKVPYQHSDELNHRIMITLWRKLPDFDYCKDRGLFRSWLCTVIENQARNFFREQSAAKRQSHGDAMEVLFEIPGESELAELIDREWKLYVAQLAWKNISIDLPEYCRKTFELHLQGKTTEEIMEEFSILPNTVHVYLKRCRDKLKKEIKRLTNELL